MSTYDKDWWTTMLHRFLVHGRGKEYKRVLAAASIDLSPDDLAEAVLKAEGMTEKNHKVTTYVTELDLCRSYRLVAEILLDYAEAHGLMEQ